MPLTQMNTRIDEDVKRDGDTVFAALGLSPSAVVRAVWEYAAQHKDAPAAVAHALSQPSKSSSTIDAEYRLSIAEQTGNFVSDYRMRIGADAAEPERIDYRVMREQAWNDKLKERELS